MTVLSGSHSIELAKIGLHWDESGQAGLSGALLQLSDQLDHSFVDIAGIWSAADERHPATLNAEALDRLGYLRAFPHQATFAVQLDPDEDNIVEFLAGQVVDGGRVAMTKQTPVTAALTPAACYHVYVAHRGEAAERARYFTTRNTCFRHESNYQPLQRQWNFSMREIICLGDSETVQNFIASARSAVGRFAELIDIPIDWATATDPFFQPNTNPLHLAQRISPTKVEAQYGDLAIASVNRHFEHFGELMNIDCGPTSAHSACAAFGIERWMYAIVDRHGADPASWPALADAAATVRAERSGALSWE